MNPTRAIFLMCLAEIAGMAGYAGFVAQVPLLANEWRLTSTAVGWISGAFYAGYMIAVPILVTLTDRIDPKRIYLISISASGLGGLFFALFSTGFWSALTFQLLMGVGLAGTYMPGLRVLTDSMQGQSRSRAVAFYTSSYAIGAALSFFLIGRLSQELDWRWAFGLSAIGPALAFILIAVLFEGQAGRHNPPQRVPTHPFDFRPVLRDRSVMARAIAYGAHSFELLGLWSWSVAFLTFAYSLRPHDSFQIDPTVITAIATLLLVPASVGGNECALRFGRRRCIIGVMLLSAALSMVIGFSVGVLPSVLLIGFCLIYGFATAAESGALTSSLVAIASPGLGGMTMAAYSTVGFIGAFAGPLVFGLVLNHVGPTSTQGWGWAFAALGIGALIGPMAFILLDKHTENKHESP